MYLSIAPPSKKIEKMSQFQALTTPTMHSPHKANQMEVCKRKVIGSSGLFPAHLLSGVFVPFHAEAIPLLARGVHYRRTLSHYS